MGAGIMPRTSMPIINNKAMYILYGFIHVSRIYCQIRLDKIYSHILILPKFIEPILKSIDGVSQNVTVKLMSYGAVKFVWPSESINFGAKNWGARKNILYLIPCENARYQEIRKWIAYIIHNRKSTLVLSMFVSQMHVNRYVTTF